MGSSDPACDLNWNATLLRKLQAAKNLRPSTVKETRREKKRP